MKVLNVKRNELQFATNQECAERREYLIKTGVIKPAGKNDVIFKRNSDPIVNTIKTSRKMRQKLIDNGIISTDLCKVEPARDCGVVNEQGDYKVRPIKSEDEYERRKNMYFRIMQEILHSRRDLKLILISKRDSDPDWYF
jgi:hypothetical protein